MSTFKSILFNHQIWILIFVCQLFIFIPLAHSQPWQQNNLIFNPSGIPSLSFSQPRFADLDADNDYDFILGNISENPLYFVNTGLVTNPVFQAGMDIFQPVSSLDAEMGVFVDLDQDGDRDFICGGYTGLNYYENMGDSTQVLLLKIDHFFQGLITGSYPVPTLADLDLDGDMDLLTGLSEDGRLKYFENVGTPDSAAYLESDARIWYDVGLYAYPYFSDLDNDGDFDLLVGKDVTGFNFYRNIGDSLQWQWQPDYSVFSGIAQSSYWNSPCLVDLNGDGKKDLVYGTAAGPINYYRNTGSALSPVWTAQNQPFGGVIDVGGASSPCLIDFDGDGDLDLLSGTQLGYVKYFENIGNATGPAWMEKSSYFSSIDHSIYAAVSAGDVNGDLLPDVITGDLNGGLFFHKNTGTGFTYLSSVFSGVDLGDFSAPVLVDMDGDADLDIVAGNEDGQLFYFENSGSPDSASWSEISGYFGAIDVGSNCVPAAGDIDYDGDIDIITGNLFREVTCFKNEDGSWIEDTLTVSGISGGQNTAPALGDLDGDGDPDLTLGNYDGTFDYFQNDHPPVSIPSEKSMIPRTPQLFQNYPNPFNPTTNIKFELPKTTEVILEIYNILGENIVTLVSDRLKAGTYIYQWTASNVASGVYLVRIQAEDFIQTRKMVVMR
ncbi:MAG: T9SS C-terminal target domain-containing protein [Calditrichaeota bacterium]|nr:T9SS type A sorting domain-containing protein [Calditrichota bacterium]RQV98202.1 MAG: T9SS C-terminal target domain-containing protein [Calditrichota bacterium]